MSAIIVMPLYKNLDSLSFNEKTSLIQCLKILNKHPVCFIGPSFLDFSDYTKLGDDYKVQCTCKSFDDNYFANIKGYNTLLVSQTFYYFFRKYDYLLIYQTDAFVFKDDVGMWCNKGYDYVGAPWFEESPEPGSKNSFINGGNGGFSLRNVQSSIRLLRRISSLKQLRKFWFKSGLQSLIQFKEVILRFRIFFKIKSIQNWNDIFFDSDLNEDYYWSQIIPSFFKDFRPAPVEEAIKFSFESCPALLFKINNYQLPFGCHAWEKYEPEFWNRFISFPDN